jgi:hypothetical protein
MSVIVAEVYEALLEAGASEPKARAAAAAIPVGADLATRQDIAALKQGIAKLQAEIAGVKLRSSPSRRSSSPCSSSWFSFPEH